MGQKYSICIVGGGTSGWCAAVALTRELRQCGFGITLIESPDVPRIGVGESSIPPFVQAIHSLGISERDLMEHTNATYKLAIRFDDWNYPGHSYYHPFGRVGQPFEQFDFFQCWLKARLKGHRMSLDRYSPVAGLCRQGKFLHPVESGLPGAKVVKYALHFDSLLMANYLKKIAIGNGVTYIADTVTRVRSRGDLIESLTLKRASRPVRADLYIDCTGFARLLIGKLSSFNFLSWKHMLTVDRAVAVQSGMNRENPPPYTVASARRFGWIWSIPLQNRFGNGYVYDSDYLDGERALETLVSSISGELTTDPKFLKFESGVSEKQWIGNCVALGLSAGFLEPLESTAIHLAMSGVQVLLNFLPGRPEQETGLLSAEFNAFMHNRYEEVRDFLIIHYAFAKRDDSNFWRNYKNTELPELLKSRVALYRGRGVVKRRDFELFVNDNWHFIMAGLGALPRDTNPMLNRIDYDELDKFLQTLARACERYGQQSPLHRNFLSAFSNSTQSVRK
ncbi:MAG: tryptophan 7-halogenase [Hyphomonadaceae bacterium]|nr:tryptophan 7-halogenase [Hyphomonadaceae bacterium]